jgi:pimeloyl-ACP methyl ester carboxylesterase
VALLLIDAIVGDEWDRLVNLLRVSPPLLVAMGAALLADTATTLPVLRDRQQAAKLWNLVTPTVVGHALAPWRLIGPAVSILRSRGSRSILERLADREVPTFVITGDRDLIVPPCAATSAARRAEGHLVRVRGAGHSWLLKDPETLPAIVDELLDDALGDRGLGAAIRAAIPAAGAASVEQLEEHFYEPDAPILALTPELDYQETGEDHRAPRYGWTVSAPGAPVAC